MKKIVKQVMATVMAIIMIAVMSPDGAMVVKAEDTQQVTVVATFNQEARSAGNELIMTDANEKQINDEDKVDAGTELTITATTAPDWAHQEVLYVRAGDHLDTKLGTVEQISPGVWKYTIPSGHNRVEFNTYFRALIEIPVTGMSKTNVNINGSGTPYPNIVEGLTWTPAYTTQDSWINTFSDTIQRIAIIHADGAIQPVRNGSGTITYTSGSNSSISCTCNLTITGMCENEDEGALATTDGVSVIKPSLGNGSKQGIVSIDGNSINGSGGMMLKSLDSTTKTAAEEESGIKDATVLGAADIQAYFDFSDAAKVCLAVDGVSAGDDIKIMHQKKDGSWEQITPDSVENGYVTATFSSFSPVVFIRNGASNGSGVSKDASGDANASDGISTTPQQLQQKFLNEAYPQGQAILNAGKGDEFVFVDPTDAATAKIAHAGKLIGSFTVTDRDQKTCRLNFYGKKVIDGKYYLYATAWSKVGGYHLNIDAKTIKQLKKSGFSGILLSTGLKYDFDSSETK